MSAVFFFMSTQKVSSPCHGKLYKAVIGRGGPLRLYVLKGMFRTASQAQAYGRRAVGRLNGLALAAADNNHYRSRGEA